MRRIPLLCATLLLLASHPVCAGQKSITFYLDGAVVEADAAATKGYLEYPLPDAFTPGSLRVRPLDTGKVLRVEVAPPEKDGRKSREVKRLEERRTELQDKLQSLDRREELFASAVKSQSGKSPRKSKTNPDPVAALEQGTQFALDKLDAINRSQRSCRREFDEVERKLAATRKGSSLARIWLSGKRARISYQVSSESWSPCYDLRWSGDESGELLLHARLPKVAKGVRCLVSQGTVAQAMTPQPVRGDYPTLVRHPLTLQPGSAREPRPLSFSFNKVEAALPPGEAAAFWRGEYLGHGRFSGGGASEFSIGGR
jgi:hypothetical protein